MTVRRRTNPDVTPRGRNRERADPLKLVLVPQGITVGCDIAEAFAYPDAANAWRLVRDIPQTRGYCSLTRFGAAQHAASEAFAVPKDKSNPSH